MRTPTRTLVLSIIALIAVGFFSVLINRYLQQSEAGTSKANITFSPADGQPIPEEPVQFIIKSETPGEKISAVDLVVDVKNGQFVSWQNCEAVGGSQIKLDDLKSETQGTTARKSCGILQQASTLPEAVMLSGTIACSGNDPVTVSINTAQSSVVGPIQGTAYTLGGTSSVTYDCSGSGTGGGQTPNQNVDVIAKFEPSSCEVKNGESCKYNLNVASVDQNNKISGFYIRMTYDNSIMKATEISGATNVKGVLIAQAAPAVPTPTPCASVVCPPGAPGPGAPAVTAAPGTPAGPTAVPPVSGVPTRPVPPTNPTGPVPSGTPGTGVGCSIANSRINHESGTVELLYTCDGAAANLPTSISNALTLSALSDGSGALAIADIQVTGPGRTSLYDVSKNNATYTVGEGGSGGGTGDVELDMTLRMQCIVKKPRAKDTMKVRVGLGDGGLKEPVFQTADFKVDDKGFWKGSVKFNVPPGGRYKVLPKGEYHMQKKVCDANAKENFPGAYSCDKGGITLKNGKNTIDLSNIVLLTGDIPPGDQDGLSNAKDQALIRNLIGKRDAESASLADINFDGVVNAVDHACMIAALSVRYDDQ